MAYYIGIDGGGSKTKCVLCNSSLDILYQTISGPSNFLTIGADRVSSTVIDLIKECYSNSNIANNKINGIVLGTTGAGRVKDATNLKNSIIKNAHAENLPLSNINIESDARIALEGAFSGKQGSILIAGTGSIMFGKDNKNEIHRVGGFGRLIGDEGSGLSIGRKGLNLLSKFFDGRHKHSLIIEMVTNQFDIKNQTDLINKVYNENFEIQKVAPLVMQAAEEGDDKCIEILDKETDEILLHIMAMHKKLNCEKLKLVFIGGTIANKNYYSKILTDKIKLFLPHVIIQKPDYPPEIGAVIMARNLF